MKRQGRGRTPRQAAYVPVKQSKALGRVRCPRLLYGRTKLLFRNDDDARAEIPLIRREVEARGEEFTPLKPYQCRSCLNGTGYHLGSVNEEHPKQRLFIPVPDRSFDERRFTRHRR